MAIDVMKMQQLAGVFPADDGYRSYKEAAGSRVLDEDVASGAKGWLSGVRKALGTWRGKLQKGGASSAQMSALADLDQALMTAMTQIGEAVDDLDTDDVLFEEEIPAYVEGADLDAFNTALAKLCGKLKKDLGAEAVRQNYKGTGKQKHRRQLYVNFKDLPGPDLWLETGYAKIGGVVFLPFADKSAIKYEGKTPAEVYAEIRRRMQTAQEKIYKVWADKALADKAAPGVGAMVPESRRLQADVRALAEEAIETTEVDDVFGDHLNWVRALGQ